MTDSKDEQYATEQQLGHWRNQRRNKKITWRQMEMKIQYTKIYGKQQKQY